MILGLFSDPSFRIHIKKALGNDFFIPGYGNASKIARVCTR